MKRITILLLMSSLTSCRSFERQVICQQIAEHQIKPVQLCDISFQFNRCRCRNFDFNSWTALDKPVDHPLEYCEGIAGFPLETIASDIRPNVKALYTLKGNLCE